jgi:hypothetical protein
MITTQRALELAVAALDDCTRVATDHVSPDYLVELRAASDELKRMIDVSKQGGPIQVIHGVWEVKP